ncbi:glucose-fructose oxidoreductase [Edaphobacter acidisoli]|uniref:Glucose-fructose oxidoreductase n=1 Tax=Edaphobacter acidisoli TaxID=2040573 RepID=A0A916RTK7_9BACT|nr:Gfo/Idh/MocA family oxidoreductase [Edaphobacter acidisoli]GGA69801.1 glucose-fructose oxidoreductase [Edaphobacter acidisoli]
MSHSQVRFAILGFGHHAIRRLLPAFRRAEHSTLTGLWRRDQAAAAKNAAEHNIPHNFSTREELCASPDVDVVFITSPDAMHKDDLLLAAAHGKAVLCEKPLAMNAAEAAAMAAAAKKAGILYGSGQNFRYNHTLDWMREQIAAGRIGHPQLAHAQYCYPAQQAPRRWIADPTLACGGPIADVGVHCIDALRYVLGEEVTSITTLAYKDQPTDLVEATATLQMEMTNNILANVTASARAPYRTLVEVVGSEGALTAESGLTVDRPVDVVLRRAGEVIETKTLNNDDGYVRMLDSFSRAFRAQETYRASGEDGVLNMRALDAAYKSWHSGAREKVS